MANINKRMKQNIERNKLDHADELTALVKNERKNKAASKFINALKIIVIAAIYAGLTIFVFKDFSYGVHQFRIVECLIGLTFFEPCTLAGVTIGCFIANIFGPATFFDAIIGTCITGLGIYSMKWWAERQGKPVIGMLLYAFMNAAVVALELSYMNIGASYQMATIFFWVLIGELVCAVGGGSLIYFIVGKFWEDIVSETETGEKQGFNPNDMPRL
ncbi:MAG: QueT transporter family protein [Bacillota bacterium]|nr:QueT transporter family protein [Bacillota bacterium]